MSSPSRTSPSSGLATPRTPRFRTCVWTSVVRTSLCPRGGPEVGGLRRVGRRRWRAPLAPAPGSAEPGVAGGPAAPVPPNAAAPQPHRMKLRWPPRPSGLGTPLNLAAPSPDMRALGVGWWGEALGTGLCVVLLLVAVDLTVLRGRDRREAPGHRGSPSAHLSAHRGTLGCGAGGALLPGAARHGHDGADGRLA